jgi:hypothetical protein
VETSPVTAQLTRKKIHAAASSHTSITAKMDSMLAKFYLA